MRFKRNQLEDGIWATFPPPDLSHSEFLVRIKRILETDRGFDQLIRPTPAAQRAKYAFFSGAPPGSGAEVRFSSYEVFAVLTALRLQEHGFPKARTVEILRLVRSKLENEHKWILEQDPAAIVGDAAPRKMPRAGSPAFASRNPVFLVVATGGHSAKDRAAAPRACGICRGEEEVGRFRKAVGADSWTMFELTTAALQLAQNLIKTEPRSRGRGAG